MCAEEKNSKIIIVMPAYNAEETLEKTYHDNPLNVVDEVILVDDNSSDQTAQLINHTCQKHANWTLIRLAEKSVELRGKKNALQNRILS